MSNQPKKNADNGTANNVQKPVHTAVNSTHHDSGDVKNIEEVGKVVRGRRSKRVLGIKKSVDDDHKNRNRVSGMGRRESILQRCAARHGQTM